MANILLVGTATLDMVYTLDHYPAEDDEMRAQALRVCRGGNAANTAVVLSQLGHHCSFVGVLSDAPEANVIDSDFAYHGVDTLSCPRVFGQPPTSSIYLSGGRRTIVHYRDLPELTAEQFSAVDLAPFDWVHFEARNVPQLLLMLSRVRELQPDATISLELEKPRDGVAAAWGMADLLICSRGYAVSQGYSDPMGFLGWMRRQAPQAELVAVWGEMGAYGVAEGSGVVHCPAFPPEVVVDTLGAGDTFNAGLISCSATGAAMPDALRAACVLAGRKCGMHGLAVAVR